MPATTASRRVLAAAAAVFSAFGVGALAFALPRGAGLNFVSGTWLTLGLDDARGVLYRPISGPAGFGGTRYFPLWIVLHGGLVKAGFSGVAAGHVISVAAAIAWLAAAFALLRLNGLSSGRAWPFAVLTLCSSAGVLGLTTIRGDMLPAALNLCGIASASRAVSGRAAARTLGTAAACFALAVAAKPSAAFGVFALSCALALNGHGRRAIVLAAGTAALSAVLVLWADVSSGSRMFAVIRASAGAGGTAWNVFHAPAAFMYTLVHQDPMTLVVSALTFAALMLMTAREWTEPLTCATVGALAVAVALHATPGIDYNHLVDFVGLAVIFLGVRMHRTPSFEPTMAAAISAATVMAVVLFAYTLKENARMPERAELPAVRSFLSGLDKRTGPVLASNPLVTALDDEPAFVLDPVMFQVLRTNDPRLEQRMDAAVSAGMFRAVVVEGDAAGAVEQSELTRIYGAGFQGALLARYRAAGTFAPYVVYVPRP